MFPYPTLECNLPCCGFRHSLSLFVLAEVCHLGHPHPYRTVLACGLPPKPSPPVQESSGFARLDDRRSMQYRDATRQSLRGGSSLSLPLAQEETPLGTPVFRIQKLSRPKRYSLLIARGRIYCHGYCDYCHLRTVLTFPRDCQSRIRNSAIGSELRDRILPRRLAASCNPFAR